jgi:hypothetical protein
MSNKLVRRSYWLDVNDRSLVMVMTQGIGAHLTNDEKRAHLIEHLIDQVCIQGILHPKNREKYRRNAVAFSTTPTSNVTALRQKERISDTNQATLYAVGNAADAFGFRLMCGSDCGGESHEKRYRSSSAW